jgi:hypothetical protein
MSLAKKESSLKHQKHQDSRGNHQRNAGLERLVGRFAPERNSKISPPLNASRSVLVFLVFQSSFFLEDRLRPTGTPIHAG